jgi:hypothetical protein
MARTCGLVCQRDGPTDGDFFLISILVANSIFRFELKS